MLLLVALHTPVPVTWPTMLVGNRKDQDVIIKYRVEHAERESGHQSLPKTSARRGASIRR